MKTKQIAEFGLLLAMALVLAYLESILPVMIAIPGVKLGLANIITMLVLYRSGWRLAFFFMTLRVVLTGFLFSGLAGIIYSFLGGLCCILVMSVIKKFSVFSILGVSMTGALFHNLGQILAAVFVMENAHVLYYFPVLCISGIITGMIVGYLSGLLICRINKIFPKN